MSYSEVSIIKDVNDKPVPQYWNSDTQQFEVIESKGNNLRMVIYNSDGEEILFEPLLRNIEDKLDALIGVVNQIGI